MRVNIVHPGAGELHYEIRGIVDFAEALAGTGIDITWENIGDPVAKGEQVPQWIRDLIVKEVKNNNQSYGYSPTKGLQAAREFLAWQRAQEGKAQLDPENVLFFNGLGDGINKIYTWLNPKARVMGPNPAYPTHSALEAAHGRSAHLTYKLDSDNDWLPDVDEVRKKVVENPDIAGLLIINPDNPTGVVYPRHVLQEFVAIAKQYKLFLIADEIYSNLTYNPEDFIPLAELADGVPTIILRGLSKEIPWPGSRCGWAEFYNVRTDPDFRLYIRSIEEAKMTEVCSTTLPQTVFPAIFGDERYAGHLHERQSAYKARAAKAAIILSSSPHLNVVEPKGAFYLAVTFNKEFIERGINKPAANPKAQKLLDAALDDIPEENFDKRFCHQLLAATGICTVPLTTGFNSSVQGFRMTLLESDDAKFTATLQAIKGFCE
jgi:aspartate/methionine/tyrosine aminotransferase